jgi:hypothetical protein
MSRRILVVTAQGEVRYLGSESEAVRVLTIQPTGARGATGPAGADGGTSDVKSASFTAANDKQYTVVATLTVTDPSPVEGKGFEVFLRNGTATVGGTAYTRSGTTIRRVFHSGAWTNTLYVFPIVSADISDATSAATANTVVRRDASGGAAFDDLTAATVVFTEFLQSTAANAYIGTDGASAYIATAGTNSPIFTLAADSPIYTTASNSNIETLHASASVRSYNFAALDVTEGASLRNSAGTAILTWGATAGNISITVNTTSTGHFFSNPSTSEAGHFLTKNGTTPTLAAGRSAWYSSATGSPRFKNGTGGSVTLIYDGGALGTPASGTLTSCTGLPISTGVSGLGTGVATLLTGTPSGTGGPVGTTSPTITTPTIAQINGGTAANDDLTLQGTTNATRTSSYVIIQPNGGFTGMGTSAPALPLHIVASNSNAGIFRAQNSSANGYTGFELYGDAGTQLAAFGTGNSSAGFYPGEMYLGTNTAKAVRIYTTSASNVRMSISAAGGVSIGTTTDAGATNLLVAGTLTTGAPASSTARPMKFGSVTSITDAAMVALGFTSQQKVEINAVDYWIPMKTSAWT